MKLKTSSLLIAGALFGAAVMPAQANNDAMIDLLKVLRDQGTITAQNYDLLANAAKADKESLDAVDTKVANVEKAADNGVKIETKGKFKVSGHGWTFQPIGRVMWDAISSNDDGLDSSAFGAGNNASYNGTELRRARLGFQGSVDKNWIYKFEADFATAGASGKSVVIKDAYVGYKGALAGQKFSVKTGQSLVPFGFNTAASSKYMSFIDRPLFGDSAISPARLSGVNFMIAPEGYDWSFGAALTKGGLKGGVADDLDSATIFTSRATFMPYHADKNHLIQIGASYMNQSAEGKFQFKQHLASHKDKNELFSTSLAAGDFDGLDAYDIEAFGVFGPFHVLAEYVNATADSKLGQDVDMSGYAVEAGYFLTGESFKFSKSRTGGMTPKSSAGAWQLAARFENMNVDNTVANVLDDADKFTVGVNYYANKNIRFMLDYDQVVSLESNGVNVNQEPSSVKFRAQAKW